VGPLRTEHSRGRTDPERQVSKGIAIRCRRSNPLSRRSTDNFFLLTRSNRAA
jgi:hypothetical protein